MTPKSVLWMLKHGGEILPSTEKGLTWAFKSTKTMVASAKTHECMSLAAFMEKNGAKVIVKHKGDAAPGQLTPPNSKLVYTPKEHIHTQVILHVEGLANAEIVWTVKMGTGDAVTPCGLAMVTTKQFICQDGCTIVS